MTYQFDPILGQGRDGAVSLAEQNKGFAAGTPAQQVAFKASVADASAVQAAILSDPAGAQNALSGAMAKMPAGDAWQVTRPNGRKIGFFTSSQVYAGRTDDAFGLGFNTNAAGVIDPAEPAQAIVFENDYWYPPAVPNRTLEFYFALNNFQAYGGGQFRPYGYNADYVTGAILHYFRSSVLQIATADNSKMLVVVDESPGPINAVPLHAVRNNSAVRPAQVIWGALGQTGNVWEVRAELGAGNGGNVPIAAVSHDAAGNGFFSVNDKNGNTTQRLPGNLGGNCELNGSSLLLGVRTGAGVLRGIVAFDANADCGSIILRDKNNSTVRFAIILAGDMRMDHAGNGLGVYNGAVRDVFFPPAGGISIKEGANKTQGVATLVGGTVTVTTTAVGANSRIQLTCQSMSGVAAPQAVSVTARTAGASFTITSASASDTSQVAWVIFGQA